MNLENIRFGIITPVYNRADCIARCIESLIRQKHSNFEMWIVDDGSLDETPQIVEKYRETNDFIYFHKFKKNRGVNAARNYAIQNSKCDFIIFLDSDDYFTDNALEIISSTIQKNQQYKHFLFAQDDRVNFYEANEHLSKSECVSFSNFLLEEVSGDFTHVIKSDIIKKYPFNEELRIYEGINFLQIYKDGAEQFFCNEIVAHRERDRTDSVTLSYKLSKVDAIKKKYLASKLGLNLFLDDYYLYDKEAKIAEHLIKESYLLGLASLKYEELGYLEQALGKWNKKIPFSYRVIANLRLGIFLRYFIQLYSYSKTILKL